jgi:hypothetical protein
MTADWARSAKSARACCSAGSRPIPTGSVRWIGERALDLNSIALIYKRLIGAALTGGCSGVFVRRLYRLQTHYG